MSWSTPLFHPIEIAGRKPLKTLRDAGDYIAALREAEQHLAHWQAATRALLLSKDAGDPYLGWIAMLQALQHGQPDPAPAPRRKRARVFKIVR